jgi:hypothetical protein
LPASAAKARIAAFDMVEFMPGRDIDGQGALVAAQMLAAVMGIVARQGRRPGVGQVVARGGRPGKPGGQVPERPRASH